MRTKKNTRGIQSNGTKRGVIMTRRKQRSQFRFSLLLISSLILLSAPAARADSEAGFEASSEATWGGSSSMAQSRAGSEATWGGWGSEASRMSSTEAGSEAGSESGFGYYRRPYFRRNYLRYGSGYGGYGGSGYDQNEVKALQRLKQEQAQEQQHESSLASMPDSAFVQNYGSAARPGGIVDTYRRRSAYSSSNGQFMSSGAPTSYMPPGYGQGR